MYAWHTTPGFCGTVCHTSMNKYVETYNSGNKGMLSVVHKEAGKNCLDCHNPKVTEQVSEVMAEWSGEYAMDSEGYVVMDDTQMASKEFCLKSGCHDSWDKVVQSTEGAFTDASGRVYNPHSSHQDGSITCGDCHKSHRASTLYCAKCHVITDMPEGWEATSD